MRRKLHVNDGQVVGLMIAQDFQRKGLAEAIKAMTDDPRLVLVVVGKENPSAYVRMQHERGLAGRVTFAGPTTDPYSFYAAADFFCTADAS